jgi:Flp pilus assembly protein TadG
MSICGKKQESGQNLVEFAILIPISLLIVIMILDFGRVIFYFSSLNNSTREGARHGTVADFACNDNEVINTVKDRIIGIDPNDLNITVTWNNVITTPTCKATHPGLGTVTVQAVVCFEPITPLIADFLGGGGGGICPSGTIPLDSSTTMYLEM